MFSSDCVVVVVVVGGGEVVRRPDEYIKLGLFFPFKLIPPATSKAAPPSETTTTPPPFGSCSFAIRTLYSALAVSFPANCQMRTHPLDASTTVQLDAFVPSEPFFFGCFRGGSYRNSAFVQLHEAIIHG